MRYRRQTIAILAAGLAFASAFTAHSEHVFFKDGKIISGKVQGENKEAVTLALPDGQTRVIPRANILRMLYSEDFLSKSVIQLTNGQNFEGFIVNENRKEFTIRKKLYNPDEQVIPKDQISFTARKRPSQLVARLIRGGFLLKWNKPLGSVKKFVVYMREGDELYRAVAESYVPQAEVRRGIREGTAYEFQVRLVDNDNYESPPSNEVKATSLRKGETPPVYKDDDAGKKDVKDRFSLAIGPFCSAGIGQQWWNGKGGMTGNAGGGIIIDTAAARNVLMNYRTAIHVAQDYNFRYIRRPMVGYLTNVLGTSADTTFTRYYRGKDLVRPMSIELSQAIGFGLVRTPLVRFWLGPEIVLKMVTGVEKKLYLGFSGGLGAIMGVNINLGDLVTLTFSGSCRALYSYRYTEYTVIKSNDIVPSTVGLPNILFPDPRRKTNDQNHGLGISGQLNIGVLFRINDSYTH
ncbi:MAG: hypothetical protein JW838_10880 [Spirochaetes bacterium]|nr:hypothetical protein [Spirochaetota bacterium]